MKNLRFKKDAFHPRKRSVYPDYKAGVIYPLEDDLAKWFLDRGEAEILFKVVSPNPNKVSLQVTKPNPELTTLLKTLGLMPKPQNKIRLPIQDTATLKALKNKELVKNMTGYFSDKNIPVKDIANSLIRLMDYAIDIKDDYMISKVAGDLQTLLRLTEFEQGKINDKD